MKRGRPSTPRRRPSPLGACLLWLCAVACEGGAATEPADAAAGSIDAVAETSADVARAPELPAETAPETAAQGWVPASTTDLYGAWENQDDETVRRYEFRFLDNGFQDLFNITPAYRLYRGKKGQPLEIIERGEFKLANGPLLVTTPQWAADVTTTGKTKKIALVPVVTAFAFGLEVLPGVTREFIRVETFPRFP
ncbi:MAG: hypothetical protein FJ100_05590 [Deltaproteobacteria bacterium]|nr:hypothetical protein [Deltaproteobacteria bacterium]